MKSMKVKYLKGAPQDNPMDQLAGTLDGLTKLVYPRWASVPISCMPDVTSAIKVDNNQIYRVNAPGYFGIFGTEASKISKSRSSIILSDRHYTMDCFLFGVGIVKDMDKSTASWEISPNNLGYATVDMAGGISGGSAWKKSDFQYDKNNKVPYVEHVKSRGYIKDASKNVYTIDLETSRTYYVCCPQLRLAPSNWCPRRITYSISHSTYSTTKNNSKVETPSGGNFNSMIPIVPSGVSVCSSCEVAHGPADISAFSVNNKKATSVIDGVSIGSTGTFVAFAVNSPDPNSSDVDTTSRFFIPSYIGSTVKYITNIRELYVKNITPDKIPESITLSEYSIIDAKGSWDNFNVTAYKPYLARTFKPVSTKNMLTNAFKRYGQMFYFDDSVGVMGEGVSQKYDLLNLKKPGDINSPSSGISSTYSKFAGSIVVDPTTDGHETAIAREKLKE